MPVTWATPDDVAQALGLNWSIEAGDPGRLDHVTAVANEIIYDWRQAAGYTADTPDVVPSARVLEACIIYACREYRDRGMFGSAAGYSDAELGGAPPMSDRAIMRKAGVPRPVVF
jgi:hypothetical protein